MRESEQVKKIAMLEAEKATLVMALITVKNNTTSQVIRDYVDMIVQRYGVQK